VGLLCQPAGWDNLNPVGAVSWSDFSAMPLGDVFTTVTSNHVTCPAVA
jgi:hypothetical protein